MGRWAVSASRLSMSSIDEDTIQQMKICFEDVLADNSILKFVPVAIYSTDSKAKVTFHNLNSSTIYHLHPSLTTLYSLHTG